MPNLPLPSHQVSILELHGDADPTIGYCGGTFWGWSEGRINVPDVDSDVNYWLGPVEAATVRRLARAGRAWYIYWVNKTRRVDLWHPISGFTRQGSTTEEMVRIFVECMEYRPQNVEL